VWRTSEAGAALLDTALRFGIALVPEQPETHPNSPKFDFEACNIISCYPNLVPK